MTNSITTAKLASYAPFNHLIESHREILLKMANITSYEADTFVPVDSSALQYLLEGAVDLINADQIVASITEHSEISLLPHRHKVDHGIKARTRSKIMSLDKDTVNLFLAWNEIAASQKFDIAGISNDYPQWVAEVMNNPIFESMPGESLQAILMNLVPVSCNAGDIIIQQGAVGKYYYIIAKGECIVTELDDSGELVHIATLQPGQAFGEESLLSNLPCNATVTMISNGILLRIDKNNFNRLIKEPSISWITPEQTRDLLEAGARLLDVRQSEEFLTDPVEAAINLPLRNLRELSRELDRQLTYIINPRGGMRCAAAAYLLAQRKFRVKVERPGVNSADA